MSNKLPVPVSIGLDGFNMAMPRGTGVATYGRELSRTLGTMGHGVDILFGMAIGPRTPKLLREILFFDELEREKPFKAPVPMSSRWLSEIVTSPLGIEAAEVPITGSVVADALAARMPYHDRILNVPDLFNVAHRYFKRTKKFLRVRIKNPPTIMHWTYPLPIVVEGSRNIYTIHDLVPLRLPYTTLDNKRFYLRLIRGCLRWGHHVCTVSEASRHDITSLFPVDPKRVTNTYQTAELPEEVRPGDDIKAWLQGIFGLQQDGYFLFYGALEPKKNIGRMIQAYLASGIETPLVIVGGRSWKAEGELRLITNSSGQPIQAAGRVHMLEYMPSAWLGTLVRGARAVLFASLYEGFGLPVLEAMQLGRPVLTSTTSSMPEVAGQAALLVDPYKPGAIAMAMRALDCDAELRARLGESGLQQAQKFAPARYVERLSALYRDVAEGQTDALMTKFAVER